VKGRQPLDQAIAGVNKRLGEKGLSAFDARNEASRSNAIGITIGVSLDLLSESERSRFAELAVFPEDVDVPIGIAARLWAKTGGLDEADAEDLLVRLESLSLLLSLDLERRTFRFHDMTRHFLQEQAGQETLTALHKTLLQAMDGASAAADEGSRRYFYLYRLDHLAAAGNGLHSMACSSIRRVCRRNSTRSKIRKSSSWITSSSARRRCTISSCGHCG
jgi:hypothetical protein